MTPTVWMLFLLVPILAIAIGVSQQIAHVERKVNLILRHLGVETGKLPERVKDLARDPSRKIEAIKAYREDTGSGLKDAKDAVEDWIAANP